MPVKNVLLAKHSVEATPKTRYSLTKIPEGHWQVIAADIFYLHHKEYLLVSDYFSKMFFVRCISGATTASAVIGHLKKLFSEHGIYRWS